LEEPGPHQRDGLAGVQVTVDRLCGVEACRPAEDSGGLKVGADRLEHAGQRLPRFKLLLNNGRS
jgi:hypothetical protein